MPSFRDRNVGRPVVRPGSQRKQPGGRYAGIRSAGTRYPMFIEGRYRLEIIETRNKSRNGDWFHFDARVLDAEQTGDNAPNKVGATCTGMLYMAGKGADVNLSRIKKLIMSTMGLTNDDELDEEEPDWDILLDAVMSDADAEADERFGVNPLQGQIVEMVAIATGNIDEKTQTEYCNYAFSPDSGA